MTNDNIASWRLGTSGGRDSALNSTGVLGLPVAFGAEAANVKQGALGVVGMAASKRVPRLEQTCGEEWNAWHEGAAVKARIPRGWRFVAHERRA